MSQVVFQLKVQPAVAAAVERQQYVANVAAAIFFVAVVVVVLFRKRNEKPTTNSKKYCEKICIIPSTELPLPTLICIRQRRQTTFLGGAGWCRQTQRAHKNEELRAKMELRRQKQKHKESGKEKG